MDLLAFAFGFFDDGFSFSLFFAASGVVVLSDVSLGFGGWIRISEISSFPDVKGKGDSLIMPPLPFALEEIPEIVSPRMRSKLRL